MPTLWHGGALLTRDLSGLVYFVLIRMGCFHLGQKLRCGFGLAVTRWPVSRQIVKLSTVGSRSFPVAAAQLWNSLPDDIVLADSLSTFRRQLQHYLF